ncbi:hypothetical protein SAMN04488030_1020 [Aliiroseovarius halocynthiae]|uniref:DUF1287 domain-containing protein n=1 Tax=Aliiroseovarius halocynthiae TaxID=985055 RepID=A0A545SVG7_9RHOB|nr:DUF1287 domain-containing protein [Aliiroseovarius halocynthiae]TQV68948.1 DUF1287 domain-containing protein [Aliiroseovarius halocynthiae]SMR71674.1 hypothetical protein SAMN04488030_1020 [Aliiroseovarius halocynthiae]
MRKLLLPLTLIALPVIGWAALPHQHKLVVRGFLYTATSANPPAPNSSGPDSVTQSRPISEWSQALITAARSQIGVTTRYSGAYVRLAYPNGDVDRQTGVCTDVIVRALRDAHGVDLQKTVHEDMARNFNAYPKNWGLTRPDKNIDHRRVPNQQRFFQRKGMDMAVTQNPADYQPGDLVTWTVSGTLPHIGILSDRMNRAGTHPLVIHNIGAGTHEDDILFAFPITGHYRLTADLGRD